MPKAPSPRGLSAQQTGGVSRGVNPLSFAALSSSPEGGAGTVQAVTERVSRPLGEGGIAVGDDGRGTPEQAALHLSRKLFRYAKGSLPEGAGKAVGFD